MSNFHFSMKQNKYHHNKNIISPVNSKYLFSAPQNNNFQFSMNNKNNTDCNSCPKDVKHNGNEISNVNTLENINEFNNTQKNLDISIFNNKNLQQPCKNCNTIDHIGFRINTNNNEYITLVCNPTYYFNIDKDYHFEKITILDKNNNYIVIDENMILNNSKKNLTIKMTNNFYEDLRMPLVLTAACVLDNNNVYYVHGFII